MDLNTFKEYHPHLDIEGIDKTWEADIKEHLEQSKMEVFDVEHAFAINSLHFGDIEQVLNPVAYVMDCALAKHGQFFITSKQLFK